jgi:hypothetical protein
LRSMLQYRGRPIGRPPRGMTSTALRSWTCYRQGAAHEGRGVAQFQGPAFHGSNSPKHPKRPRSGLRVPLVPLHLVGRATTRRPLGRLYTVL